MDFHVSLGECVYIYMYICIDICVYIYIYGFRRGLELIGDAEG